MPGDLKALFYRAAATAIDNRGKPAVLGKVDGTLYFTDDSGVMHRDRVWARVGEGDSRQESVVYLGKVSPQYGLPVRVDNVNGVTQVIDTDGRRATIFGGGLPPAAFAVPAHWKTHTRLGPDPGYIEGLQFFPLLVHPTNPAGMTVTVEQGSYRWQGADQIFETADSASLTSYVPGTSTVKHFIIIVLDRSTGTLAIVDGDDISTSGDDVLFGTGELTAADVQAVLDTDMLPEYWPLAAILLYNGQTAIRAKDIIFDLRPWGGEGDAASGTYVEVAGDTMTGALIVDGSADTEQLHVQGNATQTDVIVLIEQSDGTDLLALANAGQLALPVQGSGGGVLIGGDVQLYRSAANQLTIPDRIAVDAGDLTGVGIIADFRGFRSGNTVNAEFFHSGDFNAANETVFNLILNTNNASANQKRTAGGLHVKFTDLTDASRTSSFEFKTANNGSFATRLTILGKQVGIDATPAASAKLEIGGTDGALLIPRMTTTQRDALTPVAGMMVFNSSTNKHQGYDGSTWNDFY